LYDEGRHLVNIVNLHDSMLRKINVTLNPENLGFSFFKFDFSQPMPYNLSEEYMRANIYM
jgi:hypothetical protein